MPVFGSVVAAFAVVFVAELGDKTQLAAAGFGARHRMGPVLVGVIGAYLATTALSVAVGSALGAALPREAIAIGGGLLFIGFAVAAFRNSDDGDGPDAIGETSNVRLAVRIAAVMFVAELGDKTMLATATLAADGDPLLVGIGAALGIVAAGSVGVVVGNWIGNRMPERAIRIGSAVLFAIFGFALVVSGLM